jgi:hypothetical protein
MHASHILFVAMLLAPVAGEAQNTIRPGQYAITAEMDLGIPKEGTNAVMDAAAFKNQKRLECLSADDVKGDIATMFMKEFDEQNCKMSNVKTAGNKVTFTTACVEDDVTMTMTTEVTFGIDSFTTLTKGKTPEGHPTTAKTSAKRVGECAK